MQPSGIDLYCILLVYALQMHNEAEKNNAFLPPATEVQGKVMFLHLSVSHSVQGWGAGGGCWLLSMHHKSHGLGSASREGGLHPGGSA